MTFLFGIIVIADRIPSRFLFTLKKRQVLIKHDDSVYIKPSG